ncbi:MAG: PaaI family thioesterase [Acidimicrobiales bacterium]|jgi:acyl-coenzyme A thioesterase PaaI-like protein|nr:PaaI family thioesterase [Acidimicrobiales bacterium]
MHPDEYAARVALAEAARRVNRAIRISTTDPDTLRRAATDLAAVADALEQQLHPGPHCQVGLGIPDAFDPDAAPHEVFPFSPVIGPLSPVSPPVHFEVAQDRTVHGTMRLAEPYNGPPWSLTHGGVIAAVFDELLGFASLAGAGGGFTGRLTVHYRKPTPILEDIELRGWVDGQRGRKIVARGEMRHAGEITAEAEGLFIQVAGPLRHVDGEPDESPPGGG